MRISPTMVLRSSTCQFMFSKLQPQSDSTTAGHQRQGQPWGHQGGILVGFLHLLDGRHAVLQLLQGRVDAGRHILCLLHHEGVFDQACKVEGVVATSPAGVVQFMPVGLGRGLQRVRLVTVLEMLVVCQPIPRAQSTPSQATTASGDEGERTGVRPNRIWGGLPLRTLSRSSSTMSCVISTCIAWMGVVLATREPMSLSGAPRRAMPPVGSSEVAMAKIRGRRWKVRVRLAWSAGAGVISHPDEIKGNDAWREHPGTRWLAQQQTRRAAVVITEGPVCRVGC